MIDVLSYLFNFINDGKTYKSILYTSKLFYDIMIKNYPIKRYQVYNQLWSLIKLYPDKPWIWSNISINKNLTMNMIKENLDKQLDWYSISRKSNITMDIIKEYPDKPWDWSGISSNPNITMNIIKKNPDKPWNWSYIS